jgi:hypothetical protein
LGLCTTIRGSGTGGDLGGETELGKSRKDATERIQMGRTMGKKRKKKRKSCRGIITGVKLGIEEKQKEKGEEEGYMERNVHIDNEWWKIVTVYSKEMRKTTRRVENTTKMDREECIRC